MLGDVSSDVRLQAVRAVCRLAEKGNRSEGPPNGNILFMGVGVGLGLDPRGDFVTPPPPCPTREDHAGKPENSFSQRITNDVGVIAMQNK